MNISAVSSHIPSPQPEWVKRFARLGLIAKGIVYCLVGILAFMAAFNLGSNTKQDLDKQGIFRFILEQPFGQVLLALVAIGLLCYAIWRMIQAIKDTEQKGTDAKGIARRIGYAFSGLLYGSLAFYAAKLVLGSSSGSGGGNTRQTLTRKLLEQSYGQWVLGAIALGIIGLGIYQIYRAYSGKYLKKIQSSKLQTDLKDLLIRTGKIGYTARGIVWGIIGFLFMKAAINANAREAGDTSSAFDFLENAGYGPYLFGAVAFGLLCYGIFMFVRARCEVIAT